VGRPDHRPAGVVTTVRRGLIAIGALTIAYALVGALADPDLKAGWLVFLIGVLVAHDAVLLPAAIAVGALLGRVIPPRLRPFAQAALLATLAVTIVAFPLVLGRGRIPDNPSALPLHYGRGLLEAYALIWTTAALTAGWRFSWSSRAGRRRPPTACTGSPVPDAGRSSSR